MLNFDNSTARERLARNYTGAVDFGMGDFESASYLYSPKDYTIGGDTDYGALKIYDSDKYTIKTPQFKSAYHMAELVSSPLPDVPHTKKSQFDDGADLNNFLSVPKDDLVLENYVGQEAQAEGIRSEEEFFVSQARKEVAESNLNDLDKFMKSPEIEDLVTYKPSKGGKVYTETDRQAEHKAAKGVKQPLPPKKSAMPEVKHAFTDDIEIGGLYPEQLIETVFHPKLSKEERDKLQSKVTQFERNTKDIHYNTRNKREYKKALTNLRAKSQKQVIDTISEQELKVKEQDKEENKQKLKEVQEKQATLKEKMNKLIEARLGKKNGGKSEKEESKKEAKEESKKESKEEAKEESKEEAKEYSILGDDEFDNEELNKLI